MKEYNILTKDKLKISMFGHKHMLSREGGVEIVVKELATRMASKGHQVTVYDRSTSYVFGAESAQRNEYKGVKIIPVWTIKKKGLSAMTSSFIAAWKASLSDADVVHIHAEGPAAMSWLPKLFHKKVIVTIHGACEIIGTTGEKPVKSRLSENSVFYPNSNTEYRIKKLYSGFLKRFCAMPGALWCTHRAFS